MDMIKSIVGGGGGGGLQSAKAFFTDSEYLP